MRMFALLANPARVSAMSNNVVKWGVVGCGDVCEIKSLPAIAKHPDCQVVSLCRRNQIELKAFRDRHDGLQDAKLFSEYRDVIEYLKELKDAGSKVCLYVATPVSMHSPICLSALDAGINCYCEKPLARDYNECRQLVDKVNSSDEDVRLWVAYYRRRLPKFQVVESNLRRLGVITSVSVKLLQKRHLMPAEEKAHWHFDKATSGGGLIMDLGSHIFDLLDHLLGTISNCSGVSVRACDTSPGGKDGIEDVVVGSWSHDMDRDGRQYKLPGVCEFNFAAGVNLDEVTITGTEGLIKFVTFSDDLPVFCSVGGEEEELEFESAGGVLEHVHAPLLEDVVKDLIQGTRDCPSTGESAARCNLVLDKLLGRDEWK
ncbi:hypothetical protein TrST_g8463 [Triparma strigata]|uniref:Oxidoreductase n=1 Tax=Triparma strigata TaxID=1606541 RepID=A0A9W7BY61_9STRA|nr:hypothetical protein TrST_g8463 [Triparma strigata]